MTREELLKSLRGGNQTEDIAPTPQNQWSVMTRDELLKSLRGEEIAPTEEKWYEGWFQKSDADVGGAILGTVADAAVDTGTGFLGTGESIFDFFVMLAATENRTKMMMAANDAAVHAALHGGTTDGILDTYKGMADDTDAVATEIIAADLYDEEALAKDAIASVGAAAAKVIQRQNGESVSAIDWEHTQQTRQNILDYLNNEMEDASVFAHKTDELVQSGGQMAATQTLQAVGIPWWVTTFAASAGGELENAIKQEASLGEAGLSAIISAAGEVLTEQISGGIKFGGKTLDDRLTKALARGIANKFWRAVAKAGIDIVGEGLEEVLSEDISRFGQWLTYQDEETLAEMLWSEEALEAKIQAFIGGAALGGVGSVTSSVSSASEADQAYTEDIAPVGGYRVYGKDIMLDEGDIAPIAGRDAETEDLKFPGREDLADMADESIEADTAEEGTGEAVSITTVKDKVGKTGKKSTGGKERSWVGTSTGSDAVDGKILPQELDQELTHYHPISNKKTLGNANARLESQGYEKSVAYFQGRVADRKVSLDDIALGERLIQEAVKQGDYETAGDLIMDISILGTELGQKVQALSIIKRLTPEGQLKMLQKIVERGKAKGDKAYEGVEITKDMAKTILETSNGDGTYDQNALNAAVETVKQQIADQMKITVLDYINEWRYLSMLGNPKTHIRNMVSNAAMWATRQAKNAVARTIEDIAPVKNRTKTWRRASEDVKAYAKQVTEEMYEGESDNKFSEAGSIKAKRKIFKTGIANRSSKFNSDALSGEDTFFSKPAFREAFSEYLTANGIRTKADIENNKKLIAEAKQYAMEQAKEATFQQDSYIASKISEIERKSPMLNVAIGSVLPFKKTPINIAKTAVSYSPLGFARNIYDAVQVGKRNMEASEAIDHLAQTLTGTSLTLIGYALASMGFLNGAGTDDKEGEYDYQLGEQSYSFNFNGDTFSLSWLSPVAMPLFVGANAYEQLVEDRDWDWNAVFEALAQTLDPLSEMSFLSSLADVLSSYDSGMAAFGGMLESAAQSYLTSFVPTLSSQIAQVTDDTKRSTKISANSGWDFGEETWNKIKYKIPGLRQTLEPSTDIWGNEIKQSEDVLTRAFETFIAPYARREDIATAVDEEIKDLYRQTGDNGLIPSVPYNYINYKDKKYEMSAQEYTAYKKLYGQTAFDLMEELFATETYQNADSETRAEMVNMVYDYARDEAKRAYFNGVGVNFTNAKADGVEYYRENAIKGAIENDMLVDEYRLYREYPKKYAVSKAVGGYSAYSSYRSDINKFESDKDENGNAVSGSREQKVIDYINGLDAEYGEKIILYVFEYPSEESRDTYGYEIIDYLNNRSDISYSDMKNILEELGFTVDSKGNVTW